MLISIVMTKDPGAEKSKLNSTRNLRMNRGFELMLRKHKREEKPSQPKTFQVRFGKMISLFRREIHFQFDFFLDIKK